MFWNKQTKKIKELEQRLKRQAQALELKNQYIDLQEKYISKVIDKARIVQKDVFLNSNNLDFFFEDSFVFEQAREVLNSTFYHCKEISENQLLFVFIDCGNEDSASVITQIHVYHILQKILIDTIEPIKIMESLETLIHLFGLKINIVLQKENELNVVSNTTSIIYQTKEKIECVLNSSETIQEVVLKNVEAFWLFSEGIISQRNHDDNQSYSPQQLLHFIDKTKTLSKKEQFSEWENELDEWMGCCSEQSNNMLLIGVKL